MFESIQMAPADPVLGLSKIFNSDPRNNKINLGIGVYVDKTGNTPILPSVKQAEEWLLNNEVTKNYLSIEGIHNFNFSTQTLLFGYNNDIVQKKYVRTVQTPGGTGALRIAAEFISRNTKAQRIWISAPSWINHKNIFLASGLEVCTYPYYDVITKSLNFEELFDNLKNVKNGDVVLFHACCHNPTGIDLNSEQWTILSELAQKNQWLTLFDLAYQGFAHGLQEDLKGLHIFCKNNSELIICNSYSKNFGLYNERVGACTVIAKNQNQAENIFSQLCSIIRSNYSNPPSHGASIVSIILNNQKLKDMWEKELKCMREHISCIRKKFIYTLQNNSTKLNKKFDFLSYQQGMFCFIGLSNKQVQKLKKESGIYLVGSGRINLSGLSEQNMLRVSQSIIQVIEKEKDFQEINIL